MELTELKSMLSRTELFLSESQLNIHDTGAVNDENTRLLEGKNTEQPHVIDVEMCIHLHCSSYEGTKPKSERFSLF